MDHRLKHSVSGAELAEALGLESFGKSVEIAGIATLDNEIPNALVFCKHKPERIGQRVIIVPQGLQWKGECDGLLIFSPNPRLSFIRALDWLIDAIGIASYDFDAEIHPSARLGENVVVERGCRIAENVVIEHNVVIHSGTVIGKNSRIRACSCVGGDGFGFERDENGVPLRFPHLGGVTVGQNVEIGALNSIVRGTLADTLIEDFVKTDNLVHIAHNCHIKSGALITACAELSGGVTVGRNAWIGPNCSVIQKVSVGDAALVGIGSNVITDVEPSSVTAGNPSRHRRFL